MRFTFKKIELHLVKMPMKRKFATGFGTIEDKKSIILFLYDNFGYVGCGEISILSENKYHYEVIDLVIDKFSDLFCPIILNSTFSSFDQLNKRLNNVKGYPHTKAAIEFAFCDALIQHNRINYSDLCDRDKKSVLVGDSLPININTNDLESSLERGYKRIKFKINQDTNISKFSKYISEYSNIEFNVDCNGSFEGQDSIDYFKQLEYLGISIIEQPYGSKNFEQHAALANKLNIKICLDESVNSLEDVKQAIVGRSATVLNIKPAKLGFAESLKIIDYCKNKKIGLMVGGSGETGVGRLFALGIASKERVILSSDISVYNELYYDDILLEPLQLEQSRIEVRPFNSIYEEINHKKLIKYTIAKYIYNK